LRKPCSGSNWVMRENVRAIIDLIKFRPENLKLKWAEKVANKGEEKANGDYQGSNIEPNPAQV